MFCIHCGKEINTDDTFCGYCGNNITKGKPKKEDKPAMEKPPLVKNKLRCEENHYYDGDKFGSCPTCNPDIINNPEKDPEPKNPEIENGNPAEEKSPDKDIPDSEKPTVTIFDSQNDEHDIEETDKTGRGNTTPIFIPSNEENNQDDEIPAATKQDGASEQKESTDEEQDTPLQEAVDAVSEHDDAERIKTIGILDTPSGIEPVVGWLVCIRGQYAGQIFNLKAGNNFIGRDKGMNVHLAQENSVTRYKHCIITYEPVKQNFYIDRGEGESITYLNNKIVLKPTKMKTKAIIKTGQAEFMFIPLCIKGFRWEDYL